MAPMRIDQRPLLGKSEREIISYRAKLKHSYLDDGSFEGIIESSPNYRWFFVIIGSFGIMMNNASRGILGVSIVAMTNMTGTKIQNQSDECFPDTNPSSFQFQGEFDWNAQTQGIVLSAFAYGYTVFQLPGGLIAGKYGGKRIFGIGILASGILNALVPACARAGVGYMITVQVLIGLFLGVTVPAMQSMLGRTAPIMERSKMFSIVFQGGPLGTLISQPVTGALCNTDFLGGWPSVYYLLGIVSVLWTIPWFVFVKDTSDVDLSVKCPIKIKTIPWKAILTSVPAWGICITHMAYGWVWFTMTTFLPTYLSTVLKFDVSSSGLVSSIPFMGAWIAQLSTGTVVDFFRKRGYVRTVTARKICTSLGCILPAALLATIYSAGCDRALVIVILSFSMGFLGLCIGGVLVNHIDIASNYSGELMGISNALCTISGIIAPTVIGYIIEGNPSRENWQEVFYIGSCVNISGAIVYIVCAKGEEQTWNRTGNIHVDEHTSLVVSK